MNNWSNNNISKNKKKNKFINLYYLLYKKNWFRKIKQKWKIKKNKKTSEVIYNSKNIMFKKK